MKVRRVVAAIVIAWVVFLVATIPAERILALVPPVPGVAIGNVQGTLWSGRASSVSAEGVRLDSVRWRFRPLSVLAGRFEFGLDGELAGRPLHTLAGRTFFGARYLKDVQASIPAADVLYHAGLNHIGVNGQLLLDLDDVNFSLAGVPMFSGQLRWTPADVEAPIVLPLGTASLITQNNGDATSGTLEASGGVLLVKADVTLDAGGAYRMDAMIHENGTVPQAVTKFLSTFAEHENGGYRLKWSDSLL